MTLPAQYIDGAIDSSLKGIFNASPIKSMIYGKGTCLNDRRLRSGFRADVEAGTRNTLKEVISKLGCSKAYIITGKSLDEKTPVIREIEKILGPAHAGTFSKI